jgi:hypothetical protein
VGGSGSRSRLVGVELEASGVGKGGGVSVLDGPKGRFGGLRPSESKDASAADRPAA